MFFRSLLFLPANRILERLEKALNSQADAVVLDLEDGVGEAYKDLARAQLLDVYKADSSHLNDKKCLVGVRLNALGTKEILKDVALLTQFGVAPDFFLIAKTRSHFEVDLLDTWLQGTAVQNVPFLATIETLEALDKEFDAIARYSRVQGIVFGCGDLGKELGVDAKDMEGLVYARQKFMFLARKNKAFAIDGPCLRIKSEHALHAEIRAGLEIGFEAKIAIHPGQVKPINTCFSPGVDAVDRAKKVLEASKEKGNDAFMYDGEMIDAPVLSRLKQVITLSEKLKEKE